MVGELAGRSENGGVWVWQDEEGVKPGEIVPVKIAGGLERSPNAFGWGRARFEAGMGCRGNLPFRELPNASHRFIPLRPDEAPINRLSP